jgi:uncharacterized integral membrane protein
MQDSVKRVQYRGTGFYVGVVAIVVFALALLVLAVLNTQEVEVDFGFVFTVPLFAVAIGAVIIGVVLDELIGLVWRRQRRIHLEARSVQSGGCPRGRGAGWAGVGDGGAGGVS